MLKNYKYLFLALLGLYVALVFGLPTDPEILKRYSLSVTDARLLNLTIILPVIAIYLSALYGFMRMYNYALSVRTSKEGPGLLLLARGLMVLAFTLAVGSVIGALNSYVKYRHPQWSTEMTIVRNYISLIIAFGAFYFIARGVQTLYDTLSRRSASKLPTLNFIIPIVLASVFTWLIVGQDRHFGKADAYHMPTWLLILTLVIPYTYLWSLGLRATLQLLRYSSFVKGKLYRRALSDVSKGVGVLIIISILVQLLTTLSGQLNRLSVTPVLAIIYFLVILYAVGYGLVARGVKSLKKIEEV